MAQSDTDVREVIDARGLQCPMPLVRASQAIRQVAPGESIRVLATDRGSVPDFQAWIKNRPEYELVSQENTVGADGKTVYVHVVRRRS
ncbi:hypothetical protein FJZ36_04315 [Candidatus Poribacteria bacterium]|nr:hypothetical protein [Candidatus Poribacteria bacterium]